MEPPIFLFLLISFVPLAGDFLLRVSLESTWSVLKRPSCLPHSSHNPRIITRPSHFTPLDLEHNTTPFIHMFQIKSHPPYIYDWYQTHSYPSLPPLSLSLSLSRSLSLMASLLHQLSLVFLLFLASSSFQIHARESRFMKVTRPEDAKEATPIPEETPAVKKEDPSSLPPLQSLSGRGYGLYGHGQEQFTPATTTNYNNNNYNYNNARPNTELASENYENKYNGEYNYANQFKYAYNRPSKFSNQEFNRESYETARFDNVDPKKQYGLSDTRFLDNGRYFHDVNADRSRYRYDTYPTRGNTEAGARGGNYGNGVYGNGNSNYGYSNTVGGYQNNQVNQESQEEYVP